MLFSLVYMLSFLTGVAALFQPPKSLIGAADQVAVGAIAIFLIIGSILAGVAGYREYWKVERVGLWFLSSAMLTYLLLVLYLHAVAITGSRLLQAGTISLALTTYLARYLLIRWFTRRPGSRGDLCDV